MFYKVFITSILTAIFYYGQLIKKPVS